MKWGRSFAPLLLVAAAVGAPPAQVANASHVPDASAILAGHNTITARHSATLTVELPHDVTLPLKTRHRSPDGPADWLTFDGDGRVVAIILGAKNDPNGWFDGLVAVRYQSCRRGCKHAPVNALGIKGKAYRGKATLSAGVYALHVLTDGAPVTIQLRLHSLQGTSRFEVTQDVPSDVRTPEVKIDPHDDVTAYSAGSTYRFPGPSGLLMTVNVMRDDNYHGGHFQECIAPDHPVPDDVEELQCVPLGWGITFAHTDSLSMAMPHRGGFILTTFFGTTDAFDGPFNGDSRAMHYSFRVLSPGPMGELWSQGALLTF